MEDPKELAEKLVKQYDKDQLTILFITIKNLTNGLN